MMQALHFDSNIKKMEKTEKDTNLVSSNLRVKNYSKSSKRKNSTIIITACSYLLKI